MGDPTTEELENAVNVLQQEISDSTDCEYFFINLHTNGFYTSVSFLHITLWSTESDDRMYLLDDEREDIESHLRTRIKEELGKIATINIQ